MQGGILACLNLPWPPVPLLVGLADFHTVARLPRRLLRPRLSAADACATGHAGGLL